MIQQGSRPVALVSVRPRCRRSKPRILCRFRRDIIFWDGDLNHGRLSVYAKPTRTTERLDLPGTAKCFGCSGANCLAPCYVLSSSHAFSCFAKSIVRRRSWLLPRVVETGICCVQIDGLLILVRGTILSSCNIITCTWFASASQSTARSVDARSVGRY